MVDLAIRKGIFKLVAVLALIAGAQTAHALPISFTVGLPDISSDTISVTYDNSTDEFTAQGSANNLKRTDGTEVGIAGSFEFAVGVAGAGAPVPGINLDSTGIASGYTDNLRVNGTLLDFSIIASDLLLANVTEIGDPDSNGSVVFLAVVTGGALVGTEFQLGDEVGIILNTGSPGIAWTDATFTGITSATADVAIRGTDVPVPGSLVLILAGLVGGFIRRSQRA